jgi:hypothetical protein
MSVELEPGRLAAESRISADARRSPRSMKLLLHLVTAMYGPSVARVWLV